MSNQELNIKQQIKGRPMLYWAGKKPLGVIKNYPAQLVEKIGDSKNGSEIAKPNYENLKDNWHNLLFHGDNKECLSTLLTSGFRGKIDLIYIDPPFDSKADYVKKIELRGVDKKLSGEEQSFFEQVQYTDLWKNDEYLQFMFERLILLRELLSEQGSIYLHCDWHKSHHLRFLLDEVFGEDNFVNEVVWCYTGPSPTSEHFPRKHDNILRYSKSSKYIFDDSGIRVAYKADFTSVRGVHGKKDYDEKSQQERHEKGKLPEDWWADISNVSAWRSELLDYPTQKPEALLERIIKASSNKNSIILDCFAGSGTTLAVAEKLNRRWIGADCNKGSVQTTIKRLSKIKQEKTLANKKQDLLKENQEQKSPDILHFRVNNYDFQTRFALREIIFEKYGIEKINDTFFDGILGEELVKVLEFNNPLTRLEIQQIKDELKNMRSEEERNIIVICSGQEVALESEISAYNKLLPINKIKIRDIQKDGLIAFEPAFGDVLIKKNDNKTFVEIKNYLSPTILKRLEIDKNLFEEQITDFRAQIDVVLFDFNFDGKVFNICFSDIPAKKKDLVKGKYEFENESNNIGKIAVKIIDMLGEETLIAEQ